MPKKFSKFLVLWLGIGLLVALVIASGCGQSTETGAQTPGNTNSPSVNGTLSGKVTNSLTGKALSGVAITVDPAVQNVNLTTDANGAYSASLPVGIYTLTFKKDNFQAATQTVSVTLGQTSSRDVVMKATSPVTVSAGAAQSVAPGATVTLKAAATVLDGSSITGYKWTQTAGVPATIDNASADTIKVTLGNAAAYKGALVKALKFEDRFVVQGINPHSLSAAETASFKVTVTTSTGSYSTSVNVTADIPYEISTGLQDVPKGVPVLLHGKSQTAYSWSLTTPSGAKAALDNAADQNPSFIPDVAGKYTVTEKNSGASINVYAGTWAGAITGVDAKGQLLASDCTGCHNGKVASDNFTDWSKSGHAQILTQNINDPAGHWSESCASCHSVGYDTKVNNGGFDDAMAAEGWKVPAHGDPGNWSTLVSKYPKTAKLANIQCENCHGPNNEATLHANGTLDAARISISSELCGSCHGEPQRHGRFQQWEESGHGNFELAIDESGSASCARCHTGQGFLTWIKQGDLTKQLQGAKGNATADELKAIVTKDNAQPQTCAVCHDPHNVGTVSGDTTDATVRIVGDTSMLPAGFQAKEVGKGAICMTCHNTRNGLHNDANAPTAYQAPHTAAQADVLMGENAYFVSASQRSSHSYLKDTCVTCHMEASPPPAEFSLNGAGTNHGFTASIEICGTCHSSSLDGKALQAGIEDKILKLGQAMSNYLLNKASTQLTILEYTPHDYGGKSYDVKSDPIAIQKSNIVSVEPTEPHGQQGFIIKLKSPITVTYKPSGEASHTMTLSQVQVQLGDVTTDGKTPLVDKTDALVKAGWNYFLLHGDGSLGVHNPSWANDVLNASIAALK